MVERLRAVLFLLVFCLGSAGCTGPAEEASRPGDPEAVEVLLNHWRALRRGEWEGAYKGIHPDLKTARSTLKAFTDRNAKRLKAKGLPQEIRVSGSERRGDDVVVSFDLLSVPTGGGDPVAVPPRRRVTLRRAGGSWKLVTLDVLALGP
jgi:hypothetical protein